MIQEKTILVTGGAGSVGQTIVRRLLSMDPESIRILDNSEGNLAQLQSELADDRCRYFLGDIRDQKRLNRAMENVDIVIHTAGIKHVDLSEYNPFEAVKTNIMGIQNLIDAALDAEASRLVFTSSDKAVNPANTMGTTKLLAEKLITAGNKYRGNRDIRLASVRFGNILNSSESVVPLFIRQIRNGGPVTLTDEQMTRFFLTYDEVADLIIDTLDNTRGGEIFIRKMPVIKIADLADVLIRKIAPEFGYSVQDIEVEVVGPRIGETIHEDIMTEREAMRAVENETMYAILPETDENFLSHDGIRGFQSAERINRSSADVEPISRDRIVELLNKSGAFSIIDG